jgi:putative phosphoesterase
MRVAIVSDVHGNLTALEALIADLRETSPDLVVQGGDLAASGSRPAEVIDAIRDRGWAGVVGNTDEMLWNPQGLEDLRARVPALRPLVDTLFEIARLTAERIGPARLEWLRALPYRWAGEDITVVHASPDTLWRSPLPDSPDEDLAGAYGGLGTSRVVFGHIHRPFVRTIAGLTVANSGSVSLAYDGDPRAAYALVDDDEITIRRVAYDVEREAQQLVEMRYPMAEWIGSILRSGRYVEPPSTT